MVNIDSLIDPRIQLGTPCRDDADVWAKIYMLKVIHKGVNKLISSEASLEFYDTVVEGTRDYHSAVLKDVKINNKVPAPPPKIAVNKDNIHIPQNALLQSFKQSGDPKNPHNILTKQRQGRVYSVMHDDIQKFKYELNGVMARTLSKDMDVTIVPLMLQEIPGGSLNAEKLVEHIINIIAFICPLGSSAADQEVSRHLLHVYDPLEFPSPPTYMKICTLTSIDIENKYIELEIPHWPAAIVADGCSTNVKAGDD